MFKKSESFKVVAFVVLSLSVIACGKEEKKTNVSDNVAVAHDDPNTPDAVGHGETGGTGKDGTAAPPKTDPKTQPSSSPSGSDPSSSPSGSGPTSNPSSGVSLVGTTWVEQVDPAIKQRRTLTIYDNSIDVRLDCVYSTYNAIFGPRSINWSPAQVSGNQVSFSDAQSIRTSRGSDYCRWQVNSSFSLVFDISGDTATIRLDNGEYIGRFTRQ
jgi:hypothetical protein